MEKDEVWGHSRLSSHYHCNYARKDCLSSQRELSRGCHNAGAVTNTVRQVDPSHSLLGQ